MVDKVFNFFNILPDVYICPLRKKGAPLLAEWTVKCTLWQHSKFTEDAN